MKKILIVPSWQVWPLYSGGAHAQTFALESLSTIHDVHIILTQQNTQEVESFKIHFPNVKVHELGFKQSIEKPHSKFSKLSNRINQHINNVPKKTHAVEKEEVKILNRYKNLYEVNSILSEKIRILDHQYNFDFVQYEMDYNIPLIFDYQPKGKAILVLHEVPSKIIQQQLKLINTASNYYHQVLLTAFLTYEKNNLSFFDKIVTFNNCDKKAVIDVCEHKDVVVSAYSIKKENVLFNTSLTTYNLLFTGGGHHFPNYHGLEWFLNHVMPMVIQSFPSVKLFVTGSWQISFCERYRDMKQVIFLGTVSKERLAVLHQENIMISPVFIGSGLRTKILSALSYGVPIITTHLEKNLIENMENGTNCFLQDAPIDYFEAILLLLNDSKVRSRISIGAKELYENTFDYEKLVNNRLACYN